jgi:hypothetical protein
MEFITETENWEAHHNVVYTEVEVCSPDTRGVSAEASIPFLTLVLYSLFVILHTLTSFFQSRSKYFYSTGCTRAIIQLQIVKYSKLTI